MSYNGWTNYETWVTNLWMDASQGSQEFWRDTARECESAYDLGQAIKAYHDEFAPETTGVFADLLGAALHSVNWTEIANHILDEVNEEEE